MTNVYHHTVTTNALDLEGRAVGEAALWGHSLSVDECLGVELQRGLQCSHCHKQPWTSGTLSGDCHVALLPRNDII